MCHKVQNTFINSTKMSYGAEAECKEIAQYLYFYSPEDWI